MNKSKFALVVILFTCAWYTVQFGLSGCNNNVGDEYYVPDSLGWEGVDTVKTDTVHIDTLHPQDVGIK